jgi:hypothetical protein
VDQAFRLVVTGRGIQRVVFRSGGRVLASRSTAPFRATVTRTPGLRTVTAGVTFTDGSARTLTWRFRICATAAQTVRRSPSRVAVGGSGGFTG